MDDDDIYPTDLDLRDGYPVLEWRVAAWREAKFGVPQPEMLRHGQRGYSLGRPLPPGSDQSWMRGTWASVPLSWLDRWTDLWIECRMTEGGDDL